MRLATEFPVVFGTQRFMLRPTLRAATRLHVEFGGLDRLITQLAEGSLTAMAKVIGDASADDDSRYDLLDTLLEPTGPHGRPAYSMREIVNVFQKPCVECVLAMIGANREPSTEATSGPISFDAYVDQLFEIATGWLHWPPQVAWDATPDEILSAHKGHLAQLSAIFGSGKQGDSATYDPNDTSVDRAGIEWLRSKSTRKAA